MEAAFAWLGQSVEWFGKFIPRWVILDTTIGAVKFVRGQPVACMPGQVHWYWPVTTTWKEIPFARQTDDLRTQTLVTLDDKVVFVGGMIVTEIEDLLKFAASNYDGPTTIVEMALTAIHDVCCQYTWDELKLKQRSGSLDREMRDAARKELRNYGVKVIKVMLTDLAPGRVYRLVNSNQNG